MSEEQKPDGMQLTAMEAVKHLSDKIRDGAYGQGDDFDYMALMDDVQAELETIHF